MWWNANARVRWVRNVAIPEIERFMARDDNDGAFRIAREAIAVLPDDPYVKQLWVDTTFLVTFESEPSGAEVSVKGYLAHDAEWIPIGRTPLENVRVPYAHVRTRLTKPGFTPLEASLSSFKVEYTLDPEGHDAIRHGARAGRSGQRRRHDPAGRTTSGSIGSRSPTRSSRPLSIAAATRSLSTGRSRSSRMDARSHSPRR